MGLHGQRHGDAHVSGDMDLVAGIFGGELLTTEAGMLGSSGMLHGGMCGSDSSLSIMEDLFSLVGPPDMVSALAQQPEAGPVTTGAPSVPKDAGDATGPAPMAPVPSAGGQVRVRNTPSAGGGSSRLQVAGSTGSPTMSVAGPTLDDLEAAMSLAAEFAWPEDDI